MWPPAALPIVFKCVYLQLPAVGHMHSHSPHTIKLPIAIKFILIYIDILFLVLH